MQFQAFTIKNDFGNLPESVELRFEKSLKVFFQMKPRSLCHFRMSSELILLQRKDLTFLNVNMEIYWRLVDLYIANSIFLSWLQVDIFDMLCEWQAFMDISCYTNSKSNHRFKKLLYQSHFSVKSEHRGGQVR